MRTEDFDFYLPEELIAQHPLAQRVIQIAGAG